MKKLLQHIRTGKIEIVEVPPPSFRPGFVLVKTLYSAISRGTELSVIELLKSSIVEKVRRRPRDIKKILGMVEKYGIKTTYSLVMDKLNSYLPLGYSISGEVLQADESSEFSRGDIVACGGSEYASHQEIALVPLNMCIKIPEGVHPEEASFTTIGSIAVWALREADVRFGEKGLVVGLGLLGMLTSLIMKSLGVSAHGVDLDDYRVKFAQGLGINASNLAKSEEDNFDFVIVAASSKDSAPLTYALERVRRRGRIVVLGSVPIELERDAMYEKEAKISVSRSYGPGRYDPYYELLGYTCPLEYLRWNVKENMYTFLNLLSNGKLPIKDIITQRFNFEDAPKAYDAIRDKSVIGAVFVYSGNTFYLQKKYKSNLSLKNKGGIRVGVIGAGNFMRNFILPYISRRKDVVLDIVCNERPESAYLASSRFGFLSCTTSHKEVLKSGVDLVIIGTRHDTHGMLVKESLSANKAVYVEKPLSLSLQEVYEIRELMLKKGGFLHVGFNRRFSEGFVRIRSLLNNSMPLTGYIRIIAGSLPKTHWAKIKDIGGDRITGEVCHFIDAAVFLAGSHVNSVFAKSIKRGTDFDDNLHITLRMENGSVITILYTEWGSDKLGKEYYELHQKYNSVMLYDFKQVVFEGKKKRRFRVKGKGHAEEVRAIIEGLKKGEPPVPFEDIFNVTLATFAVEISLRENREVFIKEF